MFIQKPIFFALLFCSVLLTVMNGCKKDNDKITRLPDITVTPIVVTEKYIGDTATVTPTVSYDNQQASFTYKWYKFIINNTKSSCFPKKRTYS